jgi:hypothetical protein
MNRAHAIARRDPVGNLACRRVDRERERAVQPAHVHAEQRNGDALIEDTAARNTADTHTGHPLFSHRKG